MYIFEITTRSSVHMYFWVVHYVYIYIPDACMSEHTDLWVVFIIMSICGYFSWHDVYVAKPEKQPFIFHCFPF